MGLVSIAVWRRWLIEHPQACPLPARPALIGQRIMPPDAAPPCLAQQERLQQEGPAGSPPSPKANPSGAPDAAR